MQQWPEILDQSKSNGQLKLQLQIPKDLIQFDGHFPGFPILPGVVQIDWVIKLAKQHLQWEQPFLGLENIKFQNMILPGTQLTLEITADANKNRLSFVYFSDKEKYSSGKIIFKSTS